MNDGTDEDFGSDDHGHHEENESCRAVYGQCNSQEKPDGQVMSKNELRPRSPDMATRENCVSEVGSDVQDAISAASQYGAENRHSCKERTDDNIGSRILLRHMPRPRNMRWEARKEIASYSLDSVGIRQLFFRIEALVHMSSSSINVAQKREKITEESK